MLTKGKHDIQVSHVRHPLSGHKWLGIAWQSAVMSKTAIEEEIALLEKNLAEAEANKPAHETTGAYQAVLLEIEDELAEKRQALAGFDTTDRAKPT